MKRIILAAVVISAVSAMPARAQVPVIDNSSLLQQLKSYYQDLKQYALELQQLQQQVAQVQWAAQTFQSFVHNPNLGTAMGLMNQLGIDNPLPVNPYAVQSLLNGGGGISGTLGALSSLSTGSWDRNNVYRCQDDSWTCQQQQANANGIAGAQGIAMQVYQQISARYPVMQALRQRLASATTPKDVQDVQAAIANETLWVQSANAQLQTAQLLASAQRESRIQRADEKLNQDIDQVIAAAPKG